MSEELSYSAVGATQVAQPFWQARPAGFRSFEQSVQVGSGEDVWRAAAAAVECWGVKTRSGFAVDADAGDDLRVRLGQDRILVASVGPFRLREPVRVVSIVAEDNRRGFAYGTREGHPVWGEEAFVVHRSDDDDVWLTLRSLTRSATGRWRIAFPFALVAQRWYRRRYLRSLRDLG